MLATCPRCSHKLSRDARFCPHCGAELSGAAAGDTEFRRWHRRVVKRQTIFCGIAVLVGLLFFRSNTPVMLLVSGLGLLGFVIGVIRLSRSRAE